MYEAGTHRAQGVYMREAFRARDNSGGSVFYAGGIKGLTKEIISVTFSSPTEMAAFDKIIAEKARHKTIQQSVAEDVAATTAPESNNASQTPVASQAPVAPKAVAAPKLSVASTLKDAETCGSDCPSTAQRGPMKCEADSDCGSGGELP
jgi:hypothetical protein